MTETATATQAATATTQAADPKAAQAGTTSTQTAQAGTAQTTATAAAASTATKGTLVGGDVDGATETVYKLELPKESLLAADAIERTTAKAREWGLPNDKAQAVLQHASEEVKAYVERSQAEFVKQRDSWFEEVKADKVLGGEFLKENAGIVKQFSEKWLSKETRQFLNESGFGNHPMLFRDLVKLARASGNDKAVHGASTTVAKAKSDLEKMFPNSVGGGEKKDE